MDSQTLANFNNIHNEAMRVKLKELINTVHANQGLYNTDAVGVSITRLKEKIRLVSQDTMKLRNVDTWFEKALPLDKETDAR